jgi:6-phosphogluconolactonase
LRTLNVVDSKTYAQSVTDRLAKTLSDRDFGRPFHLFLSGGSTPKVVYAGLAELGLDWSQVHLWWGDERFVPPDHPDSNYRMVKEQLLDKVDIPVQQVHSWPILSSPELSAETYEREFRSFFESDQHQLDVQLLGMGDDGHTASLFPGTKALNEVERLCVASHVEGKDSVRLSLTFPALSLSERVIFLIKGEGKARALQDVIERNLHPASKVFGRQSTEMWLDQSAASQLSEMPPPP